MDKTIDIRLLERIANLPSQKLSEQCIKVLNNSKNGSSIINFRCTQREVVELFELCALLGLDKTSIIKGSLTRYKNNFLKD
jgi:hypothetical protein